jgi:hypothetical protein
VMGVWPTLKPTTWLFTMLLSSFRRSRGPCEGRLGEARLQEVLSQPTLAGFPGSSRTFGHCLEGRVQGQETRGMRETFMLLPVISCLDWAGLYASGHLSTSHAPDSSPGLASRALLLS